MPDGSSLPEIKISQLPVADTVTGTDQIELNQAGVSRSGTIAQIAATVPPPDLSDYVTDEELADIIASIPPPPTTLPPSGLASGDLAGFYPNPSIKPSVALAGAPTAATAAQNTNTTQLATCEFVNLELGGQLGFFLPLTGGTLTGPLHGTTADYTSTTPGAKVLSVTGTTTSAAQDYFDVKLFDATGGAGSAMRVLSGPTGTNPLFQVDRAGDTQVAGWLRALSTSAPVAGGADYFAYTLGNGVGGNIGVYAGIGAPTFQTYGAKGALYLDMGGAVPWYNVDGAFTWAKVGTGSGGSTITVSDTPPGSPTAGALWWNSVLGTLFIYYQDANSSQWVPAAPSAMTAWPGATGGQNFLSADVALNATGTVFSIVNTGSIGAAGQIFDIDVGLALLDASTISSFDFGIHDGTSYQIATRAAVPAANVRTANGLSLRTTLTGATTFTLRAQNASSTTGVVGASAGSPFGLTNHSTYIKWTRVA